MAVTLNGTGNPSYFGEFKKQQNYLYTSTAIDIGKGKRSNPDDLLPYSPAPNTYNVAKDGS